MNNYSISKISTYNQCPKKYKFKHIDKIKVVEEDDFSLRRGNYVHEVFEYWGTDTKIDHSYLSNKELDICESIIEDFQKSSLKKYLDFPGSNELKFALDMKLKPIDFFDKNVLIRGKIDKVIFEDEKNITAIDWKIGKVPRSVSYDQLSLYSAFLFIQNPEVEKINCLYVYVQHNKEILKTYTRSDYKKILVKQLKKIKEIETQIFFKKNPSRLCDWCEFKKSNICKV